MNAKYPIQKLRGLERSTRAKLSLGLYRLRCSILSRINRPSVVRDGTILLSSSDSNYRARWNYYDETWTRVVHRFEHRKALADGLKVDVVDSPLELNDEVSLRDGVFSFQVITTTKDEWAYLDIDSKRNAWKNYSWRLKLRRDTPFREYQIAFRYQDFYNRYRYRFENDSIIFDIVSNGKFINKLAVVPFKMDLGVWYDVRIDVVNNRFRLFVNGLLMHDNFDFNNQFPAGSIALILWEDAGSVDIRAAIGPLEVVELVPHLV